MNVKTVLLVEDDPADARLIQRAFDRTEGQVAVLRLQNGDDAVAYLQGTPPFDNRAVHPMPHILVLDIKLPRRSGLEVLQWIRTRTSELRLLPVVMLTSSRHSVDINRAYTLGANSYLAKPESSDQLLSVIGTLKNYWLLMNQNPAIPGTA
jgi:CheY-like chemotaxis protein